MNTNLEQRHPRELEDREIVNLLLKEEATDYNLAELARLRIRYRGFPGARKIQKHLDVVLDKWQLTEDELYQKTRQIHAQGQVYRPNKEEIEKEDWT